VHYEEIHNFKSIMAHYYQVTSVMVQRETEFPGRGVSGQWTQDQHIIPD
jgi:hypothetical protein